MRREWRILATLIVLNVLVFAAVGYWTGIAPRMRAIAEMKSEARGQIESLASLLRGLPYGSRVGVVAQIPSSLGTRVVLVRQDGTVVQDSAGEFLEGSRIERGELTRVKAGRPVVTVERLPSGSNALYSFAHLEEDLVLIQSRRAEGVTLRDTVTLVSLFLLTSAAQSVALYSLARYRRNQEKQDLEERLALAHQHESFQREFIANAAHELRTPIWSIKLFAEEMVRDERSQGLDVYVDPIIRASDRLSALVSQLLDLSRLEAGILELRYSWIDVEAWLAGLLRMLTPQAQAMEARLTCQCQNAGQVCCDPQLLGQAVSNLVENAIKYGGKGVSVSITATKQDDQLRITVQDTGPGISPEHLPHIFERFYRVDKDRSRRKGGAGLGLAITQRIVELHGGTLSAVSELGIGTTMRMMVPSETDRECKES